MKVDVYSDLYLLCVVIQMTNDIYNLFIADLPIEVVSHESFITA